MGRRLRCALGLLGTMALAAAIVIAPPSAPAASAAPRSDRVAGVDRYGTSAAVSKAAYPKARSAKTVVVASGATFADAVSAGPVAAKLGGPLLLVAGRHRCPA